MADLPTGTVTFLFTDIEGSTRLLQDLGEDYARVLADYRRLLRAAFAEHGGTEVDTQGDALFVVFPRARDAVDAALAAQRATLRQRWPKDARVRVRMGLHTGTPRISEGGYVGIDVHRAARIASAAWGGQVIISQATRELIIDDLPEGLQCKSLGEHRLKDLTAPQHLHQIIARDLPGDFPLPRSLDAMPNNLPVQATSLVGRESELAEIEGLLENPSCRLLTLVGPGGIGKTRLALEAAARRVEKHPHGVYFVPLAAVPALEFLIPAVANALQFSIEANTSPKDPQTQLLDFLRPRSVLLLLDNFEHLVEGGLVLEEFLTHTRDIKLIVTSRERLNLRAEWAYEVRGLTYPGNGDGGGVDNYGALALFAERAMQADPGFSISRERAHAARICYLVDGAPLGIELAAAWMSTLSCREIAEEVARNLDFLATSMRDVPEKHRSLRAAFEHSWSLLSGAEQRGLARLSVFRGGFGREAAALVAGLELPMLAELMNKSLVRRSVEGRYEIHELLRHYLEDKLRQIPDELEAVRERHSRYYAAFLSDRANAVVGPRMKDVRDEIRAELANVSTAVLWQAQHGREEDVRDTFAALRAFYFSQGWHEGVDAFRRIAEGLRTDAGEKPEAPGVRTRLRYSALAYQAFWTCAAGDADSDVLAKACLPKVRQARFTREVAACLCVLGTNASNRGDYAQALQQLNEGVALLEACPDYLFETWAHIWLGWTYFELGDYDQALKHYRITRELAENQGDRLALAFALDKLGILADAQQDYGRASELHQEAHEIFVQMESKAGEAFSLTRRSFSAWGLGDYDEAARLARAGFDAFASLGHSWGVTRALCLIGFAELGSSRMEDAQRSFVHALELAVEHQLISNALYALIGVGSVLARKDQHVRAAEIFAFTIQDRFTPFLFKNIAARELHMLASTVPPEVLAEAKARGEASTLEEMSKSIALNLSGP